MESPPGKTETLSPQDAQAFLKAKNDLRIAALVDTHKRGLPGTFIYVSLWATIGFLTGIYREHAAFVYTMLAVFIALAGVRILFYLRLQQVVARSFALARVLTVGLILAGALTWGLIAAATIHYPSLQAASLAMLVATPAITAGGSNILAIDRALRFGYPIATMLPAVIALLVHAQSPYHLILVFMAACACVYFMIAPGVVQRDYWEAQKRGVLLQERARQMETLSQTDALTQLPNRLYFTNHFGGEWKRACRHRYSVAILLIDLDHFKLINDTYGHPFGDLCLQRTAEAMRSVILRAGDIVARYGGEEFIVFLSNTDPDGAMVVANRLMQAIGGITLPHGPDRVQVTCSIGLASYVPAQPESGYKLISQADEMLYLAKHQGRNRVVSLVSEWTDDSPAS